LKTLCLFYEAPGAGAGERSGWRLSVTGAVQFAQTLVQGLAQMASGR
jgi:hypothetical protein